MLLWIVRILKRLILEKCGNACVSHLDGTAVSVACHPRIEIVLQYTRVDSLEIVYKLQIKLHIKLGLILFKIGRIHNTFLPFLLGRREECRGCSMCSSKEY